MARGVVCLQICACPSLSVSVCMRVCMWVCVCLHSGNVSSAGYSPSGSRHPRVWQIGSGPVVLLISNICMEPHLCVCLCLCVCVCVSLNIWMWSRELTFARLGVSSSHMQTHTSGWQAANVPLIPATAALATVISNFSLDRRIMMAAEMLSIPSGQCWGEADTVECECKCGW